MNKLMAFLLVLGLCLMMSPLSWAQADNEGANGAQEHQKQQVQKLLDQLKDKKGEDLLSMIKVLGDVGSEETAEKFMSMLATEKDQKVIDALKKAFARLGGKTPEFYANALDSKDEATKKIAESLLPDVMEAVFTYTWAVRDGGGMYGILYDGKAQLYMEKLNLKAIPFIKEKLEKSKDLPLERTRCALLLGATKRVEAVALLNPLADDKFAEVRYMTARALGMIGLKECKESVAKLMVDKNQEVRHMAMIASLAIEGEVPVDKLFEIALGNDPLDAKLAVEQLEIVLADNPMPKEEDAAKKMKAWQEWWKANKATAKVKTHPVAWTVGEEIPAGETK